MLSLVLFVVLLAGCGKDKNDSNIEFSFDISKLNECTDVQKNNELKGRYLPEIIDSSKCVVINIKPAIERVENHVADKTDTQKLCLWNDHGNYDWLCITDS